MSFRPIILTIFCFFLVISCRVQKNIRKSERVIDTIDTSDSTIQIYQRVNADWLRINESLLRRDGMLVISFDSIASVLVMPDHTIRAVGYNPRIESSKSEVQNLNIRDSVNVRKVDSLKVDSSKKKQESESEESFSREVTKTPSLTPWIGAGVALSIVILAVLYFFFKRR